MNNFLNLLKTRRSQYIINNKTNISQSEIINTIKNCLKYTPSAFNSQTGRIVILFDSQVKTFWNETKQILKNITPVDQFENTAKKIDSFAKSMGVILFFEEQNTIHALQEKFSLYQDNFQTWSEQSSGMLQFAVWLALTQLGLGANLQHYNPLIDEMVQTKFQTPASWKLIAQMNFGQIQQEPNEKTFLDTEKRMLIFS